MGERCEVFLNSPLKVPGVGVGVCVCEQERVERADLVPREQARALSAQQMATGMGHGA